MKTEKKNLLIFMTKSLKVSLFGMQKTPRFDRITTKESITQETQEKCVGEFRKPKIPIADIFCSTTQQRLTTMKEIFNQHKKKYN